MNYGAIYKRYAKRYLKIDLTTKDRLSNANICVEEKRLHIKLPKALRIYYSLSGKSKELNNTHNFLRDLKKLEIDGEYLVFMDENQFVVSWGIKIVDLDNEDPPVWQRNNTPPTGWHPENMTFTKFLKSMLEYLSMEC
jgi:hypothetical protein